MQHFSIDKATYKLLKKERTNIDRAMLAVGVLAPIATTPQIVIIYSERNAGSVSVFTWGFYFIAAILTLAYSVNHKLRPLIISSILWIIADGLVVIGWILFR